MSCAPPASPRVRSPWLCAAARIPLASCVYQYPPGPQIGFWSGGREALWEEKLGLREGFSGNEATAWGTEHEDTATADYIAATGHDVSHVMFQLYVRDSIYMTI